MVSDTKIIKICYLTFGLETHDGANSTQEFIRLGKQHPSLEVKVITSQRRWVASLISISRITANLRILRNSDIIHYVPRLAHLFLHPVEMLYALLSCKLLLDLRSVNIQSGYKFFIHCLFVQAISKFAICITGNAGSPRSYGVSRRYVHVPIGVDSEITEIEKSHKIFPDYDFTKTNLIYVGSFNKTRHIDSFLDEFSRHTNDNEYKLHIIGDAPDSLIKKFSNVNFVGKLDRRQVLSILKNYQFICICYMAPENHDLAPAIKLLEYSYFGQKIVANETPGLMAQVYFNGLTGVTFVPFFDEAFWRHTIRELNVETKYRNTVKTYHDIFYDVVAKTYRSVVDELS